MATDELMVNGSAGGFTRNTSNPLIQATNPSSTQAFNCIPPMLAGFVMTNSLRRKMLR